jgi:Flp pilus assembly protein TadD
MRFVDAMPRAALRAAVLVAFGGLAGCAAVNEGGQATRESASARGAAASPGPGVSEVAAPPTVAPATAASAPAAAEPDLPVAPATRRAYDDALRQLRAGHTDAAEKALRAIAQAYPELGGPHANLGLIHRQAGKFDEAVADFERAAKANPHRAGYFNQLGITCRQAGQFAKAREAYERAIELDANDAAPVLNLGILHDLYLGDGVRALELYDRYLLMTPAGDPAVTKWVADLKNRQGRSSVIARKEKP